MAKEVRYVRFSEETVALIEKQEGADFSKKIDNLLYRSIQELPEKQRELDAIQQQIARERQELAYIRKQQSALLQHIRSLTFIIQSAERETTRVVSQLEQLVIKEGNGNG